MDKTRRPFLEHLEELRRRILISAGFAVAVSAAAFLFHGILLELVKYPMERELVFISPAEAFFTSLKVSLLAGIVISSPFIIFQAWKFVGVALKKKERKFILTYFPVASILFMLGVFFGFFGVLPSALRFLLGFGGAAISPMITVGSYVSFVFLMIIVFGIVFQLPLIMRMATTMGLVEKKKLKESRRTAVVVIFISAAVLTPPDVFTQIALALPVIVLYEIGIIFSAGEKKKVS